MRHTSIIDHWLQDLRFTIRQLARYRGYGAAAIGVPALGIAASVALFGFVDAAMIKPLPYGEPSRLVTMFGARPDLAAGQSRGGVSYLDFRDWRERTRTFSSIAAYDVRAGFTVATAAGPERVPGLRVTSGFFRTLGVTLQMGRDFGPEDEGSAAPPAVLISYSAWQRRFGGSADVLGKTLTLQSPWLAGAEPHVLIGVLPADFYFPMAEHAEFWAPIRGPQGCWDVRSCRSLQAIGRLADTASLEAATADMTSVVEQLRQEFPDHHRTPEVAKLVPLRDVMLGGVGRVLLMLLAGSLLLLVIACTNLASLVLARTDSRAREIAVRGALGASSRRLVLQFATEAGVLATAAGVLGLWLAVLGMQFLGSLLTTEMISRMPYFQGIGLNLRLLSFGAAVAAAVAVVLTLTPLARISAASQRSGLEDGSRGTAGTTWRRMGAPLVVAQLAVAVVLLVGAGLLGRSLHRLINVDVGFTMEHLAGLSVSPGSVRIAGADDTAATRARQSAAVARQIADRIATIPGVQSVGYADLLPLGPGLAPSSSFWVVGRPDDRQRQEDWPVRRVSAQYFATLQAKLLRGRAFTDEEAATGKQVLVINESAARRYFQGEDPIGQSIAFGGPSSPRREIVGIVADIKDGPPETPAHPSGYVPFDQPSFALAIRLSPSTLPPAAAIRSAIREIWPGALIGALESMTERANRLPSTSLHRSTAWLVGGFAAIACVLSVIGLYGVVAYSVGRRTRELGVRIALGAQPRALYRLVLGEALWLACSGIALGAVCAVLGATLIREMLSGVSPWDPATLVSAGVILFVSALVASYVPARRAASVDPVDALRGE
jgi:predicted permease